MRSTKPYLDVECNCCRRKRRKLSFAASSEGRQLPDWPGLNAAKPSGVVLPSPSTLTMRGGSCQPEKVGLWYKCPEHLQLVGKDSVCGRGGDSFVETVRFCVLGCSSQTRPHCASALTLWLAVALLWVPLACSLWTAIAVAYVAEGVSSSSDFGQSSRVVVRAIVSSVSVSMIPSAFVACDSLPRRLGVACLSGFRRVLAATSFVAAKEPPRPSS